MDDFAPLIERAFFLDVREASYDVEDIDGHIPEFIRGTYYLNGPAKFSRAGFRYRHWLDGDGMVCALRFAHGRAHFTNRFVRSAKLVAEEEAGRPLFRAFGTTFESDQLKRGIGLESPVNVSVYPYYGTLLAFGEQGLPWELDPVTLETRGEFTFGGRLNSISPFAAHPKIDRITGELFNFGVAFSATDPALNVYRFDGQANLCYRRRLRLDAPCSMHDFSLSQSYVVFYLSPYLLDMDALMRDGRSLMDSLRWEPERGSRLLIASRATGEPVATVPLGRRYCLHLINCFEEEGRLTVDVLELERPIYDQYQVVPDLFTDVCDGQPIRFVIDPKDRELITARGIEYRLAPDFPALDPRRFTQSYNDFWMLGISTTGRRGRKFFDQLAHLSWADAQNPDIYQAPAKHYLGGEPIFIGDPDDEQTGAVICQVFDAERVESAVAIFDAFNVSRGPIALLRLKEPTPLAFHASFDPR
jgi:all-trans-8'-apo-beta-carotenal 15,15'-oxygenase